MIRTRVIEKLYRWCRRVGLVIALGSCWGICQAANTVVEKRVASLQAIPSLLSTLIHQQHVDPKQILVVFDDDNTLLTTPKYCPSPTAITCQYLGGAAWYAWQRQLLLDQPQSPDLVAPNQQTLDQIQSVLFDLIPLHPTEPKLPELITHLNQQGVSVLIETARSPAQAGATWHQLMLNHLPFKRHSLDNALASYSLPAKQCGQLGWGAQPVAVRNGILYTSGRGKGKILSCVLQKVHRQVPYKVIVMADDDKKNLDHIRDSLSAHYTLYLLQYTGMQAATQAFVSGPQHKAYQAQATRLWNRLKKKIVGTFPELTF